MRAAVQYLVVVARNVPGYQGCRVHSLFRNLRGASLKHLLAVAASALKRERL